MTRWLRALAISLTMVLGISSLGCADDLYGQCEIGSDDELLLQCESDERASCVVEDQLECQTRICGKYRGSTPFCTIECSNDGDCPSGECREFVFQSGRMHCVASVDIQ